MNVFFSLFGLTQTKYKEIPIRANKIVQAGPKSQLGGLNEGFITVGNQEVTDETVCIDPSIPTPSQKRIEATSVDMALCFI